MTIKDPKPLPSQAHLQKLLRYEPETGKLYWRERTPEMFEPTGRTQEHSCNLWNARFAGKEAFRKTLEKGYRAGKIGWESILAHRLIWKMVTGDDPNIIDHINGVRSDNRIENLRSVTIAENRRNLAMNRRNTSGHNGVFFDKRSQKWAVVMQIGVFDSKEEAAAARKNAEMLLGYHVNHGRKAS